MPGRRRRKVDYADGSMASDVAAVVVFIFGHVNGMERTVGDPGVGGASALVAPKSRFGDLIWGQRGGGRLSSQERRGVLPRRYPLGASSWSSDYTRSRFSVVSFGFPCFSFAYM
jgi:hypothetical protein